MITQLREIVERFGREDDGTIDVSEAEKDFHICLTNGSQNRLASLMTHVYESVFSTWEDYFERDSFSEEKVQQWKDAHGPLVDALEKDDLKTFKDALHKHTFYYMRVSKQRTPVLSERRKKK